MAAPSTSIDIKSICSKISILRGYASQLAGDTKPNKEAEKKWSDEIVTLEHQLNEYWKTLPVFQVTLAVARVAREELFKPSTGMDDDEVTQQNARRIYEGINTENKMSAEEEKVFEKETAAMEAENMTDEERELIMDLVSQKGMMAIGEKVGKEKLECIRRLWEEKHKARMDQIKLDDDDVLFMSEYLQQKPHVTDRQEKYLKLLTDLYPNLWEMSQVKQLKRVSPTPPPSPAVAPADGKSVHHPVTVELSSGVPMVNPTPPPPVHQYETEMSLGKKVEQIIEKRVFSQKYFEEMQSRMRAFATPRTDPVIMDPPATPSSQSEKDVLAHVMSKIDPQKYEEEILGIISQSKK